MAFLNVNHPCMCHKGKHSDKKCVATAVFLKSQEGCGAVKPVVVPVGLVFKILKCPTPKQDRVKSKRFTYMPSKINPTYPPNKFFFSFI